MSDITITTEGTNIYLASPYHADVPAAAREIGGRWDAGRKAWRFDVRDEGRVRDLAGQFFGVDGREPEGDAVTVRVRLADCEGSSYDNFAAFAGRRIAERPGRDQSVRLARNVVLVAGTLPASGGSMRYPRVAADSDVVVEIRDLPRKALDAAGKVAYEIVDQSAPDVDALMAERDKLLARLAEIDALLPEPEGTTVTTREAAAALGVSVRTVQRWASTGKVAAEKDDSGRWVVTITINATEGEQ